MKIDDRTRKERIEIIRELYSDDRHPDSFMCSVLADLMFYCDQNGLSISSMVEIVEEELLP